MTCTTRAACLVAFLLASVNVVGAFVLDTHSHVQQPWSRSVHTRHRASNDDGSFLDKLQGTLQSTLKIAQESNAQGYSFKQTLANVLAGEYDVAELQAKIDAAIASGPCVMFTWERSPSCVKAVQAFELMGISEQIQNVRLDDPWDEGNPMRAELGKRVGRTSVPIIFVDGQYVGGFDGGVSEQAPGIQAMAFQGTLRPALEAAGIKFSK